MPIEGHLLWLSDKCLVNDSVAWVSVISVVGCVIEV